MWLRRMNVPKQTHATELESFGQNRQEQHCSPGLCHGIGSVHLLAQSGYHQHTKVYFAVKLENGR